MRSAIVADILELAPDFRLICLQGEELKGVAWAVGQKIQVATGAGRAMRTYTPINWDTEHGTMQVIAFKPGDGPGSRWASGVRPGDNCQFLGPRRSLELANYPQPLVLFGDETSLGLATALRAQSMEAGMMCLFEASDIKDAQAALEATGLAGATLIGRSSDDVHLASAEADLVAEADRGAHFILTGRAASIQRVSRILKSAGVESSRIKAKAYWASGKTGLD